MATTSIRTKTAKEMTEQQENILIARLIEFREGSYNPTAMIRIIKSILSPLPHQDGASAEDVLKYHWEEWRKRFSDNKIITYCDIMYDAKEMYMIPAMHQFAQSETAKVVAVKDGEIAGQSEVISTMYGQIVDATRQIAHLEQGIVNWVRVSNERQEELNEAERRVKELEEQNKKYYFMIEHGLGIEDMMPPTYPHP